MHSLSLVLSCLVIYVHAKSLDLPTYIPACSRNELDLNACALKRAREALPHFIKGDRKYRIPDLDPIVITQLRVHEGVLGLNLTVNNARLYGLKDTNITEVDIKMAERKVRYSMVIPRVEVNCDYEIQGRILILPITGSGPGNITLMDVVMSYSYEFDLIKKADGLTYFFPKNPHLVFDTSRAYVKLDNLFNGNKLLGDQMNVFIDENWKELNKDIGPIISEAISETMRSILANIFELVDYDHSFPDIPPTMPIK